MNLLCYHFSVFSDLAHLNKKLCEPWKITCVKIYVLLVFFFSKFLKPYRLHFWRQAKVIAKCHTFKSRILLYDRDRNVLLSSPEETRNLVIILLTIHTTKFISFAVSSRTVCRHRLLLDVQCSEMKWYYAPLRVPSRFVTVIWTRKINNRHNTTIRIRQKNPYI